MKEEEREMLWLLRPKKNLGNDDNPWEPWFDKCFGFVIRAKGEKRAREYADTNAGDENRAEFLRKQIAKTKHPWLNSDYTTCIPLTSEGPEGIVIKEERKA